MVNSKKLEKKLANLLVDGETTNPIEWNEYLKKRQRLSTFKKNHLERYLSLLNEFCQILEDINFALRKLEIRTIFQKHHLDDIHKVRIPKELHQSVSHNRRTGRGMQELNAVLLKWLKENNPKQWNRMNRIIQYQK